MEKVKDHLANETDGDFFAKMKQMERDVLTKAGDTEALAILDEEDREDKEDKDE